MDLLWLNRIGIILNFLAGFMLAPELIGLERLRKFELALQQTFSNGKRRIQWFFQEIQDILGTAGYIAGFLFITALGSLGMIFLAVMAGDMSKRRSFSLPVDFQDFFMRFLELVWQHEFLGRAQAFAVFIAITFSIVSAPLIIDSLRSSLQEKDFSIFTALPSVLGLLALVALKLFAAFILINVLIILSPLVLLIVGLVYIIFSALLFSLDYFIRRLEGEDRVRGYVVSMGIAFYILGNLFQLIATF